MISWTSKLFLTGAAILAVACAKVFSPENGSGENLICAEVPSATKTALGPKDGTSYPVVWSEGDRLGVNGVASSAASIIEGGAKANFTIPSTVPLPYSIVYPYSENVSAQNIVVFPSEQAYTKDSFAPSSAPMYAYSPTFTNVQMHYLAGVIRLDIKAESGKKTVLDQISLASSAQISGEFSVNCEDGELTPLSSLSNNITYTMPAGGLTLGGTATSFFIALPKGDFGTIDATVFTVEGSAMTLHLDADKIKAGVVREYPEVTFKSEAEYYIIGNEEQMQEFATAVTGGIFSKTKAILTKDIDLSSIKWSSIDGFNKEFDGMGHKISGLSAPLFATLEGTVANVEIEAGIKTADASALGIVASKLQGGLISNVKVVGKLEYSPSEAPAEANIAGICGEMTGGEIALCTNDADIQATLPDGATSTVRIAGICAKVVGTETVKPLIRDCVNNGQLLPILPSSNELDLAGIAGRAELCSVEDCTNTTSYSFNSSTGYFYSGGLVGLAKNSSVKNCTNEGSIEFGEKSKIASYFYFAGVVGYTHTNTAIENCINKGNITLSNVDWNAARFLLGGVAGYGNENVTKITGCTNSGKLDITGKVKGSANFCAVGGIAARTMAEVSGCTNDGNISCSLQATASETGMGGVIGNAWSLSVRNCTNNASLQYNVVLDSGTGFCKAFYLGGVMGSVNPTAAGNYEYSSLENKAGILLNGSPAVLAIKTGGAAGRNNSSRDDLTDSNRIAVGGIAGRVLLATSGTVATMDKCSNSGAISAPEAGKIRYTAFGGVCGELIAPSFTQTSCSNSGNITVEKAYNDGTNLHLGGLVGFIPNKKFTSCTISIKQGENSGNISLSEINNTIQEPRAGGILGDCISQDGKHLSLTIEDCVNRGSISRVSSKRFASQSFAGGIVGSVGAGTWSYNALFSDSDALVKGCSNYGTIQFDGCTSKGPLADQTYNESATGGIVGNLRGTIKSNGTVCPAVVSSCTNYGAVKGYSGFLGGICGILSYYGTINENCVNEGEVGFRYLTSGEKDFASTSYASDLTTCGGIAGELFQGKLPTATAPGYTIICENAVNKGLVGGVRSVGGIAGAFNEGESTENDIDNCSNCGTVYGFYGKAGAITGSKITTKESLGRVKGCKVGGTVVRGSESTVLSPENYYNFVYQEAVANDGLNTYWDGK